MDDTFFMRGRQPMRDLDRVIDRLANWKRAAIQHLPQRLAVQQLRHQVRSAFKSAELVNGKNVGMVKCRCRLRLLLKAPQPLGILRNIAGRTLIATSRFNVESRAREHLTHCRQSQSAQRSRIVRFSCRERFPFRENQAVDALKSFPPLHPRRAVLQGLLSTPDCHCTPGSGKHSSPQTRVPMRPRTTAPRSLVAEPCSPEFSASQCSMIVGSLGRSWGSVLGRDGRTVELRQSTNS